MALEQSAAARTDAEVPEAGFDVRVLGPIEIVDSSGGTLNLGTRKQRALLTILTMARGQVVSADRLVDDLWGDEPPARALDSLYPYVSNLRRLMEPARNHAARPTVLITSPPGYALRIPPDAVDSVRFERAATSVSSFLAAGRLTDAQVLAEDALSTWRGPALGEFASEPYAVLEAMRLEELRLAMLEDLFEARLGQRDGPLAADVERFVTEHPLRERAWALLMRALYASGRQSDALRAYMRARTHLMAELGVEPGPELRELERSILQQEAVLPVTAPRGDPEPAVSRHAVLSTPATGNGESRATEPHAGPARRAEMSGRDGEFQVAVAALEAAAAGHARTVVVVGEPGIGKTRLVDEVTAVAASRGFKIASGFCDEDGPPPFAPWNQVLRALGHDGVGLVAPDGPVADAEVGQRRLIDDVVSKLRSAATEHPLVVVLEDLHWADRSSLKCFEFVARQLRSEAVLIVGSYRDVNATDVVHTLGGLARLAGFERIELTGIPRGSLGPLAAEHAGRDLTEPELEVLAERTSGNPFFAIELARWLGRHGIVDYGVPTGVTDVVRRQLSRLPERIVDVITVAAVVGQVFKIEVLEGVVDVDTEELFDLLDVAVVSRLIEPVVDQVTEYRFVHALVREAILADLLPLRRARLHHRLADVIAAISPSSPDLAVHRWEARSVASEPARLACRQAARAAEAAYAVVDATRWWERALQLEPEDSPTRAGVLLALGESLARMERLDEAPSSVQWEQTLSTSDLVFDATRAGSWARLLEAIDLALRADDVDTAAAAAVAVGSGWNAWHWCGFRTVPHEVNDRLEAVLGRLGPGHAVSRAAILANLAIGRYNDADTGPSDRLSAEGLDAARATSDDTLLAHALLSRALAIERPGRDPERLRCVDELLGLGGTTPDQRASALLVRAGIRMRAGDRHGTEVDVAEVRRIARLNRMLREDLQARIFEVTLAVVDGDPGRAEAMAVDAIQRGASRIGGGGSLGFLALFSMRLAQQRLGELEDDARRFAPLLGMPELDLVGPVLLARGRSADAAQLAACDDAMDDVPRDWYWLGQNFLRARVAADVDHEPLARRQYALLSPFAGLLVIVPGFVAFGVVDQVLGELARSWADDEGAAHHFAAALELARRAGAHGWAEEADRALSALAAR